MLGSDGFHLPKSPNAVKCNGCGALCIYILRRIKISCEKENKLLDGILIDNIHSHVLNKKRAPFMDVVNFTCT